MIASRSLMVSVTRSSPEVRALRSSATVCVRVDLRGATRSASSRTSSLSTLMCMITAAFRCCGVARRDIRPQERDREPLGRSRLSSCPETAVLGGTLALGY